VELPLPSARASVHVTGIMTWIALITMGVLAVGVLM
jgi:hypothetical protein